MATLAELTKDIVAAHAQTTSMTTEELIAEIQKVYALFQSLEAGTAPPLVSVTAEPAAEEPSTPSLTLKQAFKKDEVVCMVCGKGGMQTLTRHLNQYHQLKPSQYRKQFNIPKTQPLMSKSYSSKRKEIAAGMNLGANLEKARAARQVNLQKGKGKKK